MIYEIPDKSAVTEGVWAQKRRLASAIRRVIEHSITAAAPEEELKRAAERLEQYADHLGKLPREQVTWGNPEAATAGEVHGFFDMSPLIGNVNPLAPPIKLWVEGDIAKGSVTFNWAYQGPPGHAHGGFIAAAFDEVLGFANSMTGLPGMTGTLTVRYRRPTPLYTELRLEARVDRIEGRKVFVTGRLFNGDDVTAEAEAIFIAMGPNSMRALAEGQRRVNKPDSHT